MKSTVSFGLSLVILLAGGSGCVSEEGDIVNLLGVVVIDEDKCTVSADASSFLSEGFLDPTGGSGIVINVLAQSGLQDEKGAIRQCPGQAECLRENQVLNLIGFDACWFENSSIDAVDGPRIVNCEDLPSGQQRFLASSGFIEGGGRAILGATALAGTDLDELFGVGVVTDTEAADFSREMRNVIVLLRAQLKTGTGDVVNSNWFSYPVTLIPGIVSGFCADLEPVTCPVTCTSCPVAGLKGEIMVADCLPFQGVGAISCKSIDDCAEE